VSDESDPGRVDMLALEQQIHPALDVDDHVAVTDAPLLADQ